MPTSPIVYTEDTRPTMHYGTGVPSSALGADGDTYLDVPGLMIYGPKAAGAWGSGTSIQGPQGDPGAQGDPGPSSSSSPVEVGSVQLWAGLSLPANYLWCDGSSVSRTTYATLFAALSSTVATCTISNATPAVVTCVGHGLVDGDAIYFTSTGSLPTGLAVDTSYYVINSTGNTFQVSATFGGSAINTSSAGSGTHTLNRAPWGGVTATNFAVPDLRGQVPVGLDNMGGTDAGRLTVGNALGRHGGAQTHTLTESEMPSHTHVQNSHTHTVYGTESSVLGGTNGFGIGQMAQASNTRNATSASSTPTNQNTGGGAAHNNLQPYRLVNYIVRAA